MRNLTVDTGIIATAPARSFDEVRFFLETLPADQIPDEVRPHIKLVTDTFAAITNDSDMIMTEEDLKAHMAAKADTEATATGRQAPRPR